jgi:hypothetical protein
MWIVWTLMTAFWTGPRGSRMVDLFVPEGEEVDLEVEDIVGGVETI